MNRIWTALHTPCISVPAGCGSNSLPVGLQIIGRPGDDATALPAAVWIEQQLQTR
jgi:Asp-tRNA(Asn)/Glu-tRNA(Gln) amidotransferase A subunit family amidase